MVVYSSVYRCSINVLWYTFVHRTILYNIKYNRCERDITLDDFIIFTVARIEEQREPNNYKSISFRDSLHVGFNCVSYFVRLFKVGVHIEKRFSKG